MVRQSFSSLWTFLGVAVTLVAVVLVPQRAEAANAVTGMYCLRTPNNMFLGVSAGGAVDMATSTCSCANMPKVWDIAQPSFSSAGDMIFKNCGRQLYMKKDTATTSLSTGTFASTATTFVWQAATGTILEEKYSPKRCVTYSTGSLTPLFSSGAITCQPLTLVPITCVCDPTTTPAPTTTAPPPTTTPAPTTTAPPPTTTPAPTTTAPTTTADPTTTSPDPTTTPAATTPNPSTAAAMTTTFATTAAAGATTAAAGATTAAALASTTVAGATTAAAGATTAAAGATTAAAGATTADAGATTAAAGGPATVAPPSSDPTPCPDVQAVPPALSGQVVVRAGATVVFKIKGPRGVDGVVWAANATMVFVSGPWLLNGFASELQGRILCARNESQPTDLTCRFPSAPNYDPGLREVIRCEPSPLSFDFSNAVRSSDGSPVMVGGTSGGGHCAPTAAMFSTVAISAPAPHQWGAAVEVFSLVVAAGAVGSSAFTGLAAADVQLLAILAQSDCATALDRDSTDIVLYFVAPLAYWGREAMLLGNVGLLAIFAGTQLAMAAFLHFKRRISRKDAASAVRFPNYTWLAVQILTLGIAHSTFMLLFHDHSPFAIIAMLIGLAYIIGLVAATIIGGRRLIVKFVQYTQFLGRPRAVRWLYPRGFWEGEDIRQLYGKIINFAKRDHVRWFPLQVYVSIIAAFLSALPIPCDVKWGLLVALFAAAAILTAWKRPQRSLAGAYAAVAVYATLALLCLAWDLLMLYPSARTEAFKNAMVLLLIIFILLRTAYDAVLWIAEERTWHHFRVPKFEGLFFGDDASLGPHSQQEQALLELDDVALPPLGGAGQPAAHPPPPLPSTANQPAVTSPTTPAPPKRPSGPTGLTSSSSAGSKSSRRTFSSDISDI